MIRPLVVLQTSEHTGAARRVGPHANAPESARTRSRRRESNPPDSRWQRDASPVGFSCEVERATGLGPVPAGWKPAMLPLNTKRAQSWLRESDPLRPTYQVGLPPRTNQRGGDVG